MIQNLNKDWKISVGGFSDVFTADVPCSMYSVLLDKKLIPDPYVGMNEDEARELSRRSCVFEKYFTADSDILGSDRIMLRFNGIDTVSAVYFNSILLGKTDNMHRTYEYDVSPYISESGTNCIRIEIASPIEYIENADAEKHLWGVASTMTGYPHLRKAHYMFGWDWGPKLPDMGIWRSVELVGMKTAYIDSFAFRQRHNRRSVSCDITADILTFADIPLTLTAKLTAPDGTVIDFSSAECKNGKNVIVAEVKDPMLWNPRGSGEPYLYDLSVTVCSENCNVISEKSCKIGLRTITVCRDRDNDGTDGETFCFVVNGEKIFAMGANYIPEDQIISRMNPERTEDLLNQCAAANYNCIRVWGGGFYPDDSFYDCCDRLGLLVWQDFMFACSVYHLSKEFYDNIKQEAIDNIKRLRNHASLAMWCGNNEIESAWQYWGLPEDEQLKREYLLQFELLIPQVLNEYDPSTFYWPSSPSSGGGFRDSGAKNKGDIHYWEVWHSLKPFTEYKKYLFRFCSEYGFESLPSMKTIRTFASEKDFDLMSPVMEMHQKCEAGTEKLLYYLAQMMNYPYKFEHLVYLSQLVQADAIRLNVEQMRRNRGICMGSLYWQVNDSNPVISWSSIDYFGRWKALHYYAKKFYAPVIVSVDDSDPHEMKLNVSSERSDVLSGELSWKVIRNDGTVILENQKEIRLQDKFSRDFAVITDEMLNIPGFRRDECVLRYTLTENQARIAEGTYMFVQPKHFRFIDPKLKISVSEIGSKFKINIHSEAYAKGVFLELKKSDAVFSDNWFDVFGKDCFILVDKSSFPPLTPAKEVEKQLDVMSYYDVIRYKEDLR